MNAMTGTTPTSLALALISTARVEVSTRNPVSEGAVALAELLTSGKLSSDAGAALTAALGGDEQVARMLSDDIMPGDDLGQIMGGFSDGAVTAKLWRRPYRGEIPQPVEAEAAPSFKVAAVAAHAAEGDDFALAGVFGRLGSVPSGPLFRHVLDPVLTDRVVITGMGLAFSVEQAALPSLRAACEAAEAALQATHGGASA